MRILITGADGLLGRTLLRRLADHSLMPVDLPDVDIFDEQAMRAAFTDFRPDALIHCAAMTDVDGCESDPVGAFRLNAEGAGLVASHCAAHNVRMIHMSTDYVFSGRASGPWREADITEPRTVYGKSKLEGEKLVTTHCPDALVVRIAWLYGPGGPSFVHTMARLLRQKGEPLKVVDDQIGNPTSTDVVADGILQYLDADLSGIVHNTCSGQATWYEFAREIRACLQAPRHIQPCSTKDFPRPAPRPADSRLVSDVREHLKLPPLKHWRAALKSFINSENL